MKRACRSYTEDLVDDALRIVLTRRTYYCRNIRPDFMRNPETGRNLELDFWVPDLAMAFEVQGPHHYEDPHQQRLDVLKIELTTKRGVQLVALRLDEIKVGPLHRRLWLRAEELGLNPYAILHGLDRVPEGRARQHLAVDKHLAVLLAKYGHSEALPAAPPTPSDVFLQDLQRHSHLQWETNGVLGPPRRVLRVDVAEKTVLLQVDQWRQSWAIKKLRKRNPVFPMKLD